MSPEAVGRRIEELAALYELGQSLMHARILGPMQSGSKAPNIQPCRSKKSSKSTNGPVSK
jgi:hypothetical protein